VEDLGSASLKQSDLRTIRAGHDSDFFSFCNS
jgi:hypothetical protein